MWPSALAAIGRPMKRGRLAQQRLRWTMSPVSACPVGTTTTSSSLVRQQGSFTTIASTTPTRMERGEYAGATRMMRHHGAATHRCYIAGPPCPDAWLLLLSSSKPSERRMLTTSSRKGNNRKSRKIRNRDADRDSSRIPTLQNDPDEGKDDEVDADVDVDSDVDETITRPWNYGFTEYTDAEKEANGDGGGEDDDDDDDNSSDAQQSSNGRNRRLLKIARTGMVHLDRSAVYIQKQPKTSRELATLSEEGIAPDRAQMAEEYRIFTTTQECLEILCTKDRNFPLMAGEEPILLVGCTVNASLTFADIYWCLPESVWTAPDLTEHQRHYIQEEMRARLAGEPGRLLAHSVTQRLAFYYAPKVRFKEAPREIIESVVQEYEAN